MIVLLRVGPHLLLQLQAAPEQNSRDGHRETHLLSLTDWILRAVSGSDSRISEAKLLFCEGFGDMMRHVYTFLLFLPFSCICSCDSCALSSRSSSEAVAVALQQYLSVALVTHHQQPLSNFLSYLPLTS